MSKITTVHSAAEAVKKAKAAISKAKKEGQSPTLITNLEKVLKTAQVTLKAVKDAVEGSKK